MAKNKYEEAYKKSFKGLNSQSEAITERSNAFADYTKNVSGLPTQLTEEFKKRSDPTFDAKISGAEQNVLGGAIEGLNKYQGVTNPFERRALAEKYQSGLSSTYTALTDEKTRRQNTLLEYVDKWTGLFGAEAKKEEIVLNTMKEELANKMQVAQSGYQATAQGITQKESTRQYNETKEFEKKKFDDTMAFDKEKFNYTKSQTGSNKTNNSFLQNAKKTLQESKKFTGNEKYHSDTFRDLINEAPNEKTREVLIQTYGGGLSEEDKLSLGLVEAKNKDEEYDTVATEEFINGKNVTTTKKVPSKK